MNEQIVAIVVYMGTNRMMSGNQGRVESIE